MIIPRRRWKYLDVSYPVREHFVSLWVTYVADRCEFSDIETGLTLTYI